MNRSALSAGAIISHALAFVACCVRSAAAALRRRALTPLPVPHNTKMLLASLAPVGLMAALAIVGVLMGGDVARVAFAQTGALRPRSQFCFIYLIPNCFAANGTGSWPRRRFRRFPIFNFRSLTASSQATAPTARSPATVR